MDDFFDHDEVDFNTFSGSPKKESRPSSFQAPGDAAFLQMRFERLLKVTEALWSLVVEISDLSEEDLMKKVQQLKIDKQFTSQQQDMNVSVVHCQSCGKVVSRKLFRCQYCGEEYVGKTAFETI